MIERFVIPYYYRNDSENLEEPDLAVIMDTLISNVPDFLRYGAIGLIAIFAILSHFLVKQVIDAGKNATKGAVALAALNLVLFLVFAVIGGLLEYSKGDISSQSGGWRGLLDVGAYEAFTASNDAKKIEGTWHVTWTEYDENFREIPFRYLDPKTNEYKPYPPEEMIVVANGSTVSCRTTYASGEGFEYWYEGRMSIADDVTLIYWTPDDPGVDKLVGTVFLKLEVVLNVPLKMTGAWIGRTRNGNQTIGRTTWIKVR